MLPAASPAAIFHRNVVRFACYVVVGQLCLRRGGPPDTVTFSPLSWGLIFSLKTASVAGLVTLATSRSRDPAGNVVLLATRNFPTSLCPLRVPTSRGASVDAEEPRG